MKKSNFASLNRYENVQDLKQVKGGYRYPGWAMWLYNTYCRTSRW